MLTVKINKSDQIFFNLVLNKFVDWECQNLFQILNRLIGFVSHELLKIVSYFQSLSHMVQDAKFKARLDRFVDINVIRNPKDKSHVCRLCHSKLINNVKKHFMFKHLKIVEPSIRYNFTIWLTLPKYFLQISIL